MKPYDKLKLFVHITVSLFLKSVSPDLDTAPENLSMMAGSVVHC